MSEGFIVINSLSRVTDLTNPDVSRAEYSLKYANLDLNKKYEICLIQFKIISSAIGAGVKQDAEDFIERPIMVESNLVENNDYVNVQPDIHNTSHLLSVVEFASLYDIVTVAPPEASERIWVDTNSYFQKMNINNFSRFEIILKDDLGNQLNSALARITYYSIVLRYREIK